jgi:hypothetical protein
MKMLGGYIGPNAETSSGTVWFYMPYNIGIKKMGEFASQEST